MIQQIALTIHPQSHLSSSASNLSILEKRITLEHAASGANLAEDQAKTRIAWKIISVTERKKNRKRSFDYKTKGCISELWTKSDKHFSK